MRRAAHRLVALVALPVLVLGLAACAADDPAVAPSSAPEPMPTETIAGPTPPGSRMPVTCVQLFDAVDGFTGGPAEAIELDLLFSAVLDQSGFAMCSIDGSLGGTPVTITSVIGVDIDEEMMLASVEFAEGAGLPTGIGGELSWTECRAADNPPYCTTEIFAAGYLVQFSTNPSGPISSDFDASLRALSADLGERVASWPAPAEPWVTPDGALAWASDCETEVASTDAAIRAALPFESFSASTFDSGDGFGMIYLAQSRQGFMDCAWMSSGDDFGFAMITIAPGSAWIIEQGATLPGTPIDYPGAVAASVVDITENSSVVVWAVIDESIVVVDLDTGYASDDRAGEFAAAITLLDAVVAEFGTP